MLVEDKQTNYPKNPSKPLPYFINNLKPASRITFTRSPILNVCK